MSQEFTLIGIDGGATKVNGWILNFTENPQNFSLSEFNAEKKYSELKEFITDFKPVALPTQLQEMESQDFNLTENEIQQGGTYIQSCADVIETLANQDKDIPVIVGIGMPGLKTDDVRGLSAVANGPRMPHYSEKIEKILFKQTQGVQII